MSEQTDSIQKRVNDLCNEYLLQGVNITSRLILSEMPDIKSTSTIHKYLKSWKEATKQSQATLYDHLGFSQEFTQSFTREIARFGIEAERRHESATLEAVEQRDEALKGLERAEVERDEKTQLATEQAAELTELRGEISALLKNHKSDIANEKKTNEAITAELRSQIAAMSDEIKKLTQSNETVRTELAKAELRVETNKDYVDVAKAQIESITEQNKQLNNEVIKLSNKGAGQDAVLSGNDKLIQTLQSQDAQYKSLIDELREQNGELRTENKEAKNSMALLTERLSGTEERLKDYAKTIENFEKKAAITHDEKGKLI